LPAARFVDDHDRRCARLLQERLEAELAVSEAGEHLRAAGNIGGPHQRVRKLFALMLTGTPDDWAVVAHRMARVPEAFDGWHAALTEGAQRGLHAAPRQLETVVAQLDEWLGGERSWWHGFVAAAPETSALRADLHRAADAAAEVTAVLRTWLAEQHLPAAAGTPDAVGEERYRLGARLATGADLDLQEAYAWGWEEFRRLDAELPVEADRVLPGADPLTAMAHLDEHGEAVEGVEKVRGWLQELMDRAVAELSGTHFAIEGPVRRVEAMIAPVGSAAAPYYTRPSLDFARPGRTWLPPQGASRFPVWNLVSTWYHEGVPGHHLQLARWVQLADRLSVFQSTVGSVSATTEGWALYAERLMDELGYLTVPGTRMGYLDAQQMRGAGGARHRHAPAAAGARRRAAARGRDLDARGGAGVLRCALRAAGGVPGQRDRPLSRLAGAGDQLQAGRAGVAGGAGGGAGGPGRGVRPASVACGGAVPGRAGPRRPSGRAGALVVLCEAAASGCSCGGCSRVALLQPG
jgi:uncharacterized protein (DUF885 family)